MDHLQAISVFMTVSEEGGLSAAAKRLNISPASVTRAVAQLEARLGIRLFIRTTRSLHLTDAGERYLEDCRRIIPELEEAERTAAGVHRLPEGSVSVSASLLCGRMIVAPILSDLLEEYPGISLTTVYVDRVVHLINEGIDIAVRFGELPSSSLACVPVGATRRVLCASPEYLELQGVPNSVDDLRTHEIIDLASMKQNGRWTFFRNGKRHSLKPTSRLQTNSADVAIAAALEGKGIMRAASYMIASELKAGRLRILLPEFEPPPVPAHVIRTDLGRPSGQVRAVFDYLVDRLREEDLR